MEETKILAKIRRDPVIGVAIAFAEGFGKAKLPSIMNFGGE